MAELNDCSIQSTEESTFQKINEENVNDTNGLECLGENILVSGDSENNLEETLSAPFVVKVPRANSKLILQNMEEVLNSVKKKHRQKHRRKKEQKKLALMLEEQQAQQAELLNSTETEKIPTKTDQVKKPLQEQQLPQLSNSQSKGKGKRCKGSTVPVKSLSLGEKTPKSGSMLQHVKRTPRKNDNSNELNGNGPVGECTDTKKREITERTETSPSNVLKPATNAFEFMMNARNKSIGGNTPGKEADNNTSLLTAAASNEKATVVNAKRKLMLQTWADQKGGQKRKLDEEQRAAYVDKQLQRRAKRFKKLLANAGGSPQSSQNSVEMNSTESPSSEKRSHGRPLRRGRTTGTRVQRLSSEDSNISNTDAIAIVDSETEDFLSKLSTPTKKRDSLLGYFPKVPSPKDVAIKENEEKTLKTSLINNNDEQSNGNNTETPKRRGRLSKTKKMLVNINANTPTNEKDNDTPKKITTPNSSLRPKRACAGKARYDYDLDVDVSTNAPHPQSNDPKTKSELKENETTRRSVNGTRKRKVSNVEINMNLKTNLNNDENDLSIINLDDYSPTLSNTNCNDLDQTPKKLAPLFVRTQTVPKPSLDPETLKARQRFLLSGVPEKLRLEQEKQKQYEQNFVESYDSFPKLSHIHQWTKEELENFSKLYTKNIELHLKLEDCTIPVQNSIEHECSNYTGGAGSRRMNVTKGRKSLIGITDCVTKDFRIQKQTTTAKKSEKNLLQVQQVFPIISNKRQIVKSWKQDFERFPTYKCYNQLRTKYRFFSALDTAQNTTQVTESFVVTRSTRRSTELKSSTLNQNSGELTMEDDMKPPATAPNGELLYAEKYKPLLYEQVLVNLTPVSQLREFLANWANGSSSGASSNKNSQNIADDSYDFLNDTTSSTSQQQANCNSVVLLGPISSGKTNAVFTLANELNFNVLEINAGMKRTGKKLIQELHEATQSHQIRKDALVNGGIGLGDNSGGSGSIKSKAQKNLLKISLNGLKQKKPTQCNGDPNDGANDLSARKSLILIEDADIVFDQTDAGFTDAIYTLAASSKRPVIVIATNPNCSHLQRLMNQNTIKFSAPNPLSISKYLAVLSLMENCAVSLDDLISLYMYNNQDLRKTLHELQFFIQSGGDRRISAAALTTTTIATTTTLQLHEQTQTHTESESEEKTKTKMTTPEKSSGKNETTNRTIEDDLNESKAAIFGKYFASPGKRRFSEDTRSLLGPENDEQLKREKPQTIEEENLYVHQMLFEFYTVDQNEKFRIPFPVDFDLFYVNLSDILRSSKKLKANLHTQCDLNSNPGTVNLDNNSISNNNNPTKRKSRSPKKVWLSNATATATSELVAATKKTAERAVSPIGEKKNKKRSIAIETLCDFYENISIATLLVARDELASCSARSLQQQQQQRDRLHPYMSESISHELVERAVNLQLDSELCPYNLFHAPKKSQSLCDLIGISTPTMMSQSKRTRALEYEPSLRAICRSEKERLTLERRSTRFYHYLRNSCAEASNISPHPFDGVCNILQEKDHSPNREESHTEEP